MHNVGTGVVLIMVGAALIYFRNQFNQNLFDSDSEEQQRWSRHMRSFMIGSEGFQRKLNYWGVIIIAICFIGKGILTLSGH